LNNSATLDIISSFNQYITPSFPHFVKKRFEVAIFVEAEAKTLMLNESQMEPVSPGLWLTRHTAATSRHITSPLSREDG
jgi:hypothetical protein